MLSLNRKSMAQWAMLLVILVSPLPALAATTITTTTNSDISDNFPPSNQTITKREMSVGSSCDGSEGQWNCITNTFQRCASGQWSVVMDCADGTICEPAGLTYEYQIAFGNNDTTTPTSGQPSTAGAKPGIEFFDWRLLGVLGGLGVVLTAA
ncbi:hypothetical protein F5B20DRAFT_565747 [Whalleya microplaca]|nr:hypothetical protein F5B20DRAFT_565747 [Whalleya microplaca]